MYARTGEERFADLWRASARSLLARQDADGLWTQDLYGDRLRYVGAGHGFAGNVRALQGAPEWLDDAAAVEAGAVVAVRTLAIEDGDLASWPALTTGTRTGAPPRVQWCHGAPGVVTSLAALGDDDDRHGALLNAGGELMWRAGPLARNAGSATVPPETGSVSWPCSRGRAMSAGCSAPALSPCTPSSRSHASARPPDVAATHSSRVTWAPRCLRPLACWAILPSQVLTIFRRQSPAERCGTAVKAAET
jgi:hypothetical protein